MKTTLPLVAFAALFTLAACNNNQEPEIVDTNPDPMAKEISNAAPVELPPAVKESVSYRCKDNSVVFVDFLADDLSANLRAKREDMPTQVKATEPGGKMTAEGYSISGSGKSVQIAMNGGKEQNCNR